MVSVKGVTTVGIQEVAALERCSSEKEQNWLYIQVGNSWAASLPRLLLAFLWGYKMLKVSITNSQSASPESRQKEGRDYFIEWEIYSHGVPGAKFQFKLTHKLKPGKFFSEKGQGCKNLPSNKNGLLKKSFNFLRFCLLICKIRDQTG